MNYMKSNSGHFKAAKLPERSDSFRMAFIASTDGDPVDQVLGFGYDFGDGSHSEIATTLNLFSSLAIAIRFGTSGNIEAYNTGSFYTAENVFPYDANTEYTFLLNINRSSSTYDLSVNGTVIADGYSFRNISADPLRYFIVWSNPASSNELTVKTPVFEFIPTPPSSPYLKEEE